MDVAKTFSMFGEAVASLIEDMIAKLTYDEHAEYERRITAGELPLDILTDIEKRGALTRRPPR